MDMLVPEVFLERSPVKIIIDIYFKNKYLRYRQEKNIYYIIKQYINMHTRQGETLCRHMR